MLLFVAVLGDRSQIFSLHFLEGLRESIEEVIHPLLRDVCWRLTLDLLIVDGLELMELLWYRCYLTSTVCKDIFLYLTCIVPFLFCLY